MAPRSTVFKANLQIADMDRPYYQNHLLTLARHPSETDERMMVRLLAFALYACPNLTFGQGMSMEDEADVWQKDLTGAINLWIDVGTPEERLIRKACGRAKQVVLFCYGGSIADKWFTQHSQSLSRHKNLTIINVPLESTRTLAVFAERNMQLQCTIQDGQLWFGNGNNSIQIEQTVLKKPSFRGY